MNLLDAFIFTLGLTPFLGMWATYKLWRWYRFYGTRFLWGLFVTSFVSDIVSVPIAGLAIRRLIVGPDAPSVQFSGELLAISIIVLEGVFFYLVVRWRDLDASMTAEEDKEEDDGTSADG